MLLYFIFTIICNCILNVSMFVYSFRYLNVSMYIKYHIKRKKSLLNPFFFFFKFFFKSNIIVSFIVNFGVNLAHGKFQTRALLNFAFENRNFSVRFGFLKWFFNFKITSAQVVVTIINTTYSCESCVSCVSCEKFKYIQLFLYFDHS